MNYFYAAQNYMEAKNLEFQAPEDCTVSCTVGEDGCPPSAYHVFMRDLGAGLFLVLLVAGIVIFINNIGKGDN